MLPVAFLENFNGCLRCYKSLSPLKTHPDTKQTRPQQVEVLSLKLGEKSVCLRHPLNVAARGDFMSVSNSEEVLQQSPGAVSSALSEEQNQKGIPGDRPAFPSAPMLGNVVPGRGFHGKRRTGGSQDAVFFTGKGEGEKEEEGKELSRSSVRWLQL